MVDKTSSLFGQGNNNNMSVIHREQVEMEIANKFSTVNIHVLEDDLIYFIWVVGSS